MMRLRLLYFLLVIVLTEAEPEADSTSDAIKQFIENVHELARIGQHPVDTLRPLVSDLEDVVLGHPEVNTSIGKIIGTSHPETHAFYSIPYGQAPIGKLRFKPPVAIGYQETIDASVPDFKTCYQYRGDRPRNGSYTPQITMFGQSAGAQSTTFHLMSPKSKPYFKRAIMQSNPAAYYYPDKKEAKLKAEALLNEIECGTKTPLECLQTTAPEELISAHVRVTISNPFNFFNVIEPYRPVLDDEFPYQPLDYFRSGLWQNEKEVIIGTTSDEGAYIRRILQDFTMRERLFGVFTNLVVGTEYGPAVVERYIREAGSPINPNYDYTQILAKEIGDMLFFCPSRRLARFMSATSTANSNHPAVYLYLYNHPLQGPTCDNYTNFCGYAFHCAELPLLFNNGPNTGYDYSEDDILVKNMLHQFWKSFAYTGKPSEVLSEWPYYTEKSLTNPDIAPWTNFRFQAPQGDLQTEYDEDLCDFWDDLGIYVNMSFPVEVTSTSMEMTTTPMEVTTTSMEVTTTSMEIIDATNNFTATDTPVATTSGTPLSHPLTSMILVFSTSVLCFLKTQ